jgi:hypothetical protein
VKLQARTASCQTARLPAYNVLKYSINFNMYETYCKSCSNGQLVSTHNVDKKGGDRDKDRSQAPNQREHYVVNTSCKLDSGSRSMTECVWSIPLTIHCISTSRASRARLTQRSSQAKNLINLTYRYRSALEDVPVIWANIPRRSAR